MKYGYALAVVVALSGASSVAHADAPPAAGGGGSGDELAAEAAFGEGRALMAKGDYAAACPKLEASERLSPALGTLMNLAECYAKGGRPASAWITYKEAAAEALRTGQHEREQIARGRVTELEPTLCKLVVKPAEPAAAEGAHVMRDGAALDAGLYGIGIPLDPGPHVLRITGDGKIPAERPITIPAPQEKCPDTVVAFVTLQVDPNAPHDDKNGAAGDGKSTEPKRDDTSHPSGGMSGRKIGALVIGGVGIAATGVATVFALDAIGKKNEAGCVSAGCPTTAAQTENKNAGTSADVATALFITGGVLIAAGVVVWLTAPSAERASLSPLRWKTAIEF
jgi:hypothetical protein